MDELIKYFTALEQQIAALKQTNETLEARIAELERSLPDRIQNAVSTYVDDALNQRFEELQKECIRQEEPVVEEKPLPEPVAEEKPLPEPVAEEKPIAEPVVEEKPLPEPVVEEKPLPEPVVEEKPLVAEKKYPQQTSLFGASVSDIRQAVSIGDRFLFQRELFGGNGEKMQQAMNELNALHTLSEAEQYISRFGWDANSATYELFMNVLRRRFQ